MKTIFKSMLAVAAMLALTQCSDDYLDVSSPANTDDSFVTSTVSETYKTLSWCYGEYRQDVAGGGNYNWEDIVSDVEYYPENDSPNNVIGKLHPENATVNGKQTQFNGLFSCLARAQRIANILEKKSEYTSARDANKANDWTQLYGEAVTLRAFCYFQLCLHFGDVPYGIENSVVSEYSLTSRYDIYDALIEDLARVEPLMYPVGQNGITAERMNRTAACGLLGKIAMHAAGWQTIRTDVADLYGDIQFDYKGQEANGCRYARRQDYKSYLETAEKYFDRALGEAKGSLTFIVADDRYPVANNPYQRVYQYTYDMAISPESLFEVGCLWGVQGELGYSQGRPSDGGGSNAAPCKVFAGVRINPVAYYTLYEAGDKRADANMVVTGADGKGNEAILSFEAGSRLKGGISTNKWDVNRMSPPYVAKQRQMGINYMPLHMADIMLLNAEAKAQLGREAEARTIVNQIRSRAFGQAMDINATGDALLDAIWLERSRELLGEGEARWDMIRSGKFDARTKAMKDELADLRADLASQGYHKFANGLIMPAYIWTKKVQLANPLTFDADPSNPALTPGWRGVYDYSTLDAVAGKVVGTEHNLAIVGLYEYIEPGTERALALEADGYVKTDWGAGLITAKAINDDLFLGGWKAGEAPRYFHSIPFETLNQSGGNVTNGYGLPQE